MDDDKPRGAVPRVMGSATMTTRTERQGVCYIDTRSVRASTWMLERLEMQEILEIFRPSKGAGL